MHGSVVHKKLRFGPFELSIGERVLRRDGQSLPLGGRALEIWSILPIARVSHREAGTDGSRLVGRNRWRRQPSSPYCRKALGDGQSGNRYIANKNVSFYTRDLGLRLSLLLRWRDQLWSPEVL